MLFSQSSKIAPDLIFLSEVDSTNLELARRNALSALSDLSVLAAARQTEGQGRMGRTWVSEPGTSVSVSILLRPNSERIGSWVTLLAAASARQAIHHLTGQKIQIKWPNDLLFEDKKLSGILAQLQPDGSIVLGVGINLRNQTGAPETATSLSAMGSEPDFDQVLAAFLTAFFARWSVMQTSPDLVIDKTRAELLENSATIGKQVRAILPGGDELIGLAVDIDSAGHLVINTPEPVVLAAADVWHLRN